jgi:hypothetical protein
MSTLNETQEAAIREWLAAHPTLSVGIGTEEAACSVAAINLALTGELTDDVPDCMSQVIGRWVIGVQDRMPADIRNSGAWRELLPLAAGTGRSHEAERTAMVLDWMWGTALPLVQPLADARGFGTAWRQMTTDRTAAKAAATATYTTNATYAAANVAATADAATNAATAAATADAAAHAAADAAAYANAATYAAAYADAWTTLDPIGLLRQLIAITDPRALEMTR